ncbi:MAG: FmdB family zinc ribbon protein [Thermoleophilia bacterium]
MPIYEYSCHACENRFEELVMKPDAEDEVACPDCGSPRVRRLISGFSFKSSGGSAPGGSGKNCGPCSKTSCASCG